jgi:hypothetical protein
MRKPLFNLLFSMNGRTHAGVNCLDVVIWSLPSLLSVLLFACMFPIGHELHTWPRTAIAEGSFYWFLTITPLTTIVAVVRIMRFSRRKQLQIGLKALAWGLIGLSAMLNGVVLVGLATAFYY